MFHPISPDQMNMQMEHALPCIGAGVGDETISVRCDAFLARDLLRHSEKVTDQYFILRIECAN
jgi:hypothetical protein